MRTRLAVLATLAMLAAPANAGVPEGKAAWAAGDYAGALAQLRPPAEAGDAEAQFYLGEAYRLGRAVPADNDQAMIWYRRAAALGSTRARDALGLTLFASGKRAEAMPLLEKAAEGGDARALYVLGTAHFNGDNTTRDWPLAYALMMRAVAAGLPQAKTSLDVMDRYLFPADKQRAQTLYAAMNKTAPTAAAPSPPPATPVPAARTTPQRTPPLAAAPPSRTPPPVGVATPAPKTAPPKPVTAAPVRPAPTGAGGAWRVQLGAFSSADRANGAWATLAGKIPALRRLDHRVVAAAPLQRLQAVGIADRAAANELCRVVAAAGSACLPVPPDGG